MQPLTNLDASWLRAETPQTPFHIANLLVFEKPDPKKGDPFDAFREHLVSKVHELPLLHRHVDPTSLKLANPVWVNDPDVDFDYHLKRIKLDAPGNNQQLNTLVAKLHEPPLDREHPLWQAYFIEGLEDGAFAVYLKMHHSAVDGGAVNYVLDVMFADPNKAASKSEQSPIIEKDKAPTPVELMWNTSLNYFVKTPMQVFGSVAEVVKTSMSALREGSLRDPNALLDMMRAPRTPFNTSVTAGRTFGTAFLPLSEIKALGKANEATVNDIVLAICTGALRKYLQSRNQLPSDPLVVGMPVSMRPEGDTTPYNQIFIMLTTLPTNVPDVAAWLPAIRKSVDNAKALHQAWLPLAQLAVDIPSVRLPNLTNLTSLMEGIKWVEDRGLTDRWKPFVNLWLSNIPGPRKPVYCAGVPARTNIPVGIPMHGVALNITAISYLDSMDFGVIGCARAVPDAQRLADLLADEYRALKAALS